MLNMTAPMIKPIAMLPKAPCFIDSSTSEKAIVEKYAPAAIAATFPFNSSEKRLEIIGSIAPIGKAMATIILIMILENNPTPPCPNEDSINDTVSLCKISLQRIK